MAQNLQIPTTFFYLPTVHFLFNPLGQLFYTVGHWVPTPNMYEKCKKLRTPMKIVLNYGEVRRCSAVTFHNFRRWTLEQHSEAILLSGLVFDGCCLEEWYVKGLCMYIYFEFARNVNHKTSNPAKSSITWVLIYYWDLHPKVSRCEARTIQILQT